MRRLVLDQRGAVMTRPGAGFAGISSKSIRHAASTGVASPPKTSTTLSAFGSGLTFACHGRTFARTAIRTTRHGQPVTRALDDDGGRGDVEFTRARAGTVLGSRAGQCVKWGFLRMKGRKPNLTVIHGGAKPKKCPRPPAWLTSQAKAEWKRAAPELHARNLLSSDTMATLESYCVAAGMVRETEEIMGEQGRFVQSDSGPKPHPAFRMQSAAMREARLLAAELGLTPHRRGVKGKDKEAEKDGWDSDLLA